MLNMQDFREWLSSTAETREPYQRNLAELTHASLVQILNIDSPLSWFIWNTDQPSSAN